MPSLFIFNTNHKQAVQYEMKYSPFPFRGQLTAKKRQSAIAAKVDTSHLKKFGVDDQSLSSEANH